MAKEGKKFNLKLALTVAIPALIMVVIIGVIGVSFAWFTDSVTAEIATINLSVADVFVMEFVLNENTQENPNTHSNYIYSGQTAFDNNGLLVSEVHANEVKGLTESSGATYVSYMNDKAFVAPFDLRLDTEGYTVSFGCVISSVNITPKSESIASIVLPTNNGTEGDTTDDLSEEDIKLGFTWYIKNNSNNYYYTPYGTFNGLNPTNQSTGAGAHSINVADWTVPVLNTGFITSFDGDTGYNFTFNIVFAPEILFWQQYGKNAEAGVSGVKEYNQNASQVYGEVYRSDKWNAINKYSSQVYSGSTYRFTVVLTVDSAVKAG